MFFLLRLADAPGAEKTARFCVQPGDLLTRHAA
jgi:hypothetical protein